jgi:hypothetical protein
MDLKFNLPNDVGVYEPSTRLLVFVIGIFLKMRIMMRLPFHLFSLVIPTRKDRFRNKNILFCDEVFHLMNRLWLQFQERCCSSEVKCLNSGCDCCSSKCNWLSSKGIVSARKVRSRFFQQPSITIDECLTGSPTLSLIIVETIIDCFATIPQQIAAHSTYCQHSKLIKHRLRSRRSAHWRRCQNSKCFQYCQC